MACAEAIQTALNSIVDKKLRNEGAQDDDKVLLYVDNCSSQKVDQSKVFKRLEVRFLPPNTTASLQPCDAGIIKSLKSQFKRLEVLDIVAAFDNGRRDNVPFTPADYIAKANLLATVNRLAEAW